ncbi:MAG: DegV family EDD domain-containing protein [Lachnospiraceae bacterium]|nr:DegV family EDD domain-containing protein [Lachnospiraceae bacterium]
MWHLVSDSSCDLYELESTEGKMDFATIPFTIRIGGKEYVDDENMNVGGMLEANETHSEMAQTACPSPEAWREKFSVPGPVIAFTISGALSGCYNSALIGRNMVLEDEPDKQIAVIDTKATGPEVSMLIWRARDLILEGKSFEEIEKDLNETADRIHTSFALISYHNLIKSGRVSRLIGFIAGHLGFWGIGMGDEKGEIVIRGKARGSKSMVRFLVEEISKVGIAGKQIVISHCQNLKDAEALKKALEAAHTGIEVLVQATRGLDSFYAEREGLIVGY